jgi:hypothetical protein
MKELWKNVWKPLCWLLVAAIVFIWHPVFDLEEKLVMGAFALLWAISWTIGKAEETVHKRLNEIEDKIDELLDRESRF